MKNNMRNPLVLAMDIVNILIYAILEVMIYHNLTYSDTDILNRSGLLFQIIVGFCMLPSALSSITFTLEKPLAIKEYNEGLYGMCAYFISKMVSELPIQISCNIIFCVIFYFSVNLALDSSIQFFIFMGIIFLTNLTGYGYGKIAGCIFNDLLSACMFTVTIIAPLIMYGGYFSNINSLPKPFAWIKYFSSYYFGYQALALNEFKDSHVKSSFDPLYVFGLSGEIWQHAGGLLLIILGTSIISIVGLKIIARRCKYS
jgi:ABC-type multidrug transport system permease subunit